MTGKADVDTYITSFPGDIAQRLSAMRATIRAEAPLASERMSYAIPTFYLNGNLVHFAGFPRHVGFYPGPTGIAAFAATLKRYKAGKGSVQFPHDEPLPLDLVAEIVRFRVTENSRPRVKRRKE